MDADFADVECVYDMDDDIFVHPDKIQAESHAEFMEKLQPYHAQYKHTQTYQDYVREHFRPIDLHAITKRFNTITGLCFTPEGIRSKLAIGTYIIEFSDGALFSTTECVASYFDSVDDIYELIEAMHPDMDHDKICELVDKITANYCDCPVCKSI